jgi:hypothetical protein
VGQEPDVKFLAVFAISAWLPHVEGNARWFWLGLFFAALCWLLRGVEA